MQFASQIQLLGSYILIKLFFKKNPSEMNIMFQELRRIQTDVDILQDFFFPYFTLRKKILRRKLEKKTRGKAGSNIWLKGYEEK